MIRSGIYRQRIRARIRFAACHAVGNCVGGNGIPLSRGCNRKSAVREVQIGDSCVDSIVIEIRGGNEYRSALFGNAPAGEGISAVGRLLTAYSDAGGEMYVAVEVITVCGHICRGIVSRTLFINDMIGPVVPLSYRDGGSGIIERGERNCRSGCVFRAVYEP